MTLVSSRQIQRTLSGPILGNQHHAVLVPCLGSRTYPSAACSRGTVSIIGCRSSICSIVASTINWSAGYFVDRSALQDERERVQLDDAGGSSLSTTPAQCYRRLKPQPKLHAGSLIPPAKPLLDGFLTGHELTWMPEALRILRDELPNIDVMISSQYSPQLADRTFEGNNRCGRSSVGKGAPELAFRVLVKESLVVVLRVIHRLAASKLSVHGI